MHCRKASRPFSLVLGSLKLARPLSTSTVRRQLIVDMENTTRLTSSSTLQADGCKYSVHPDDYITDDVACYNEQKRLQERWRVFDVSALHSLAAASVSRDSNEILSMKKLGEWASNRAFSVEFRDGFKLMARIPYPVTQPSELIVASEAATMVFLRSQGIPVPQVYGYSATADNPAKTEYIFMEFSSGKQLSTVWSDMDEHDRLRFIRSLANLESRLFNTSLLASGSLYFRRDLPVATQKLSVHTGDTEKPDSIYVGPSTSLDLWYGRRGELDVERGPCKYIVS